MSNMNGQDKVSEKLFENKIWLSLDEASFAFGLKKSFLYKHSIYKIPCSSTTGDKNGKLLFNKNELNQWLDERKIS